MSISKKLTLLVLVSTFFFVFSGVTGMWFNLRNQEQLHDYMSHLVRKQNLLLEIYRSIGFGKGIHAFKNYILRQDPVDADHAKEGLMQAKMLLEQYRKIENLAPVEKRSLQVISETINTYLMNLEQAKAMFASGLSSRVVDRNLGIDYSQASDAIDEIQSYFQIVNKGSKQKFWPPKTELLF